MFWFHYVVFNETLGGKVKWVLQKGAACTFIKILKVTLHKTAPVKSLTFHLTNHARRVRHVGQCCRSKDELISELFLWTSTYGRASVGQPAKTSIHDLIIIYRGNFHGVVVNVLDCDIIVTKFELQPRYYIHFRTKLKLL